MRPKISIVTIAYNNKADIRPTIESVLVQDYQNIEYIVVDGGSTDGTLNIINEYSSRIDKVISEPDDGMYDAINKGISLATGDVVGLIHAGDRIYDSEVVKKIAKHFESNDIDAMYGHSILVTEDDKPFRVNKSPEFRRNLMKRGWMPSHQSVYIRREKFDEIGFYRLDLGGSADYEFILRYFYVKELKIKRLDEFIVRFSMGGRSTTNYSGTLLTSQKRHLKAWEIHGIKPPFYIIPIKLGRKIKQFFIAGIYRILGKGQRTMAAK